MRHPCRATTPASPTGFPIILIYKKALLYWLVKKSHARTKGIYPRLPEQWIQVEQVKWSCLYTPPTLSCGKTRNGTTRSTGRNAQR